jgi:mannosyl-3-phosphoglycerate phosphatase
MNREFKLSQRPSQRWVVITDLDGTLLDHFTYDYKPALPALNRLSESEIPVVFCSSKTAAEIREWQRRIGVSGAFIVENGGAVVLSAGQAAYERVAIGKPFRELQAQLEHLERLFECEVETIVEMELDRLASLTGLSIEEARRARRREYSLPFVFAGREPDLVQLKAETERQGFKLTRGGRFFHLTGGNDKGQAVRRLLGILSKRWGAEVKSVGLGDSLNDLEMLDVVDIPIVIPNPHSGSPIENGPSQTIRAPQSGPTGWNEVILALLPSSSPRLP